MVDRGERIPLAERKRRAKVHISDLKKDIKMKAKGKGNRAVQFLIILLILGVFAQNSGMISKMNKLLGQSGDADAEGVEGADKPRYMRFMMTRR